MIINGKTRVCGLIGNPVEHTMSPTIHNTIAAIEDDNMVYVPFLVEKDLQTAINGAHAMDIHGMNVTVPYKSDVISSVVEIDYEAEIIGAVNTLVRKENGYKGYNTDLLGLERALLSEGVDISKEKVIVVGAGGAARAAAFLCAFRNAKETVILNRTIEKAEKIKKEIEDKTEYREIKVYSIQNWKQVEDDDYVVLQATKVGMYPNSAESPIEESDFFSKAKFVFDLIYTPFETKFMRIAAQMGVPVSNGLKMLLYQGVAAYEMWFDKQVKDTTVEVAYKELLKLFGMGSTEDE